MKKCCSQGYKLYTCKTKISLILDSLKDYQIIKSDINDITNYLVKEEAEIRLNNAIKKNFFIEEITSISHNNNLVTYEHKDGDKSNNIFVISPSSNPGVITIKDLNIEFVLISKEFKNYLNKMNQHVSV